jgi:hypothetical protein
MDNLAVLELFHTELCMTAAGWGRSGVVISRGQQNQDRALINWRNKTGLVLLLIAVLESRIFIASALTFSPKTSN